MSGQPKLINRHKRKPPGCPGAFFYVFGVVGWTLCRVLAGEAVVGLGSEADTGKLLVSGFLGVFLGVFLGLLGVLGGCLLYTSDAADDAPRV